jgi:hypothetical protein
VLVLALSAGGLASFALTFAIPGAVVMARSLPGPTRMAAIWAEELARGGFAGATIGAAVVSLAVPPSAFGDAGCSRALVIAIAASIGLVIGGLRADRRARVDRSKLDERSP